MDSSLPLDKRIAELDRLAGPVDPQIFSKFADPKKYDELRKELRPHWEFDTRQKDSSPDRLAFRTELKRLMVRELATAIGYLEPSACCHGTSGYLWNIIDSYPGARFLDMYMYFGVRFILNRRIPETNPSEFNIALPAPPVMDEPASLMNGFIAFEKTLQPGADKKNDVELALQFVYDSIQNEEVRQEFLWWLRRLSYSSLQVDGQDPQKLYEGLCQWIEKKANFYEGLSSDALRARFAIYDLYWLARVLGADVSSTGEVTYRYTSWIEEVHAHTNSEDLNEGEKQKKERRDELRKREDSLRLAFSLACDLIQESAQISLERCAASQNPQPTKASDPLVRKWRFALDEELDEIHSQREQRLCSDGVPYTSLASYTPGEEWSRLAQRGNGLRNLVGLAFSGGGIRSATFNLGILEGLKEVNLLRKIDYVSLVSGGGYIGSWLIANVKRKPYWLSKTTDWAESIAHLRRYSNYLSPKLGILSADTWTMAGIWIRNTFLVQLVVFSAILAGILAARVGKTVFDWWGNSVGPATFLGVKIQGIVLLSLFLLSVIVTGLNLLSGSNPLWVLLSKWFPHCPYARPYDQIRVQMLVVAPYWLVSFLLAYTLWTQAHRWPFCDISTYTGIFIPAVEAWWPYLLIELICLSGLSVLSFTGTRIRKFFFGILIGFGSLVVLFASLCGIMRLFHAWTGGGLAVCVAGVTSGPMYDYAAYVWGPVLVMLALTLTIVSFLGFLGRQSYEWRREWWTRMGSWISMYGVAFLILSLAGIYGPLLAANLFEFHPSIQWTAVLGWIGTTIGGLLAGKSSATQGKNAGSTQTILKEILAKVSAIVFIAGLLLTLATFLQIFFAIYADFPGAPIEVGLQYWKSLQDVPIPLAWWTFLVVVTATILFAWRFDINVFSLNMFYRNRLVRCYLGAARSPLTSRTPQEFTGFDEADDFPVSELRVPPPKKDSSSKEFFRGPFPIVNCALNLGGSVDLSLHTRHSASFTLTPLHCGSDREAVRYVLMNKGDFKYMGKSHPTLGQAMAVSGAAANPNNGYHTSPVVAFLLTIFNVRLGWWFPNPRRGKKTGKQFWFPLKYLTLELFGLAGEKSNFVNVSDGGHFENLGVYELLRRRCKVIIAADSECDPEMNFDGLGNLIRIAGVDFGAKISINVDSIRKTASEPRSLNHTTVGVIEYSNGERGYLVYIKSALTGDEPPAVVQYESASPTFPHETTADQFFREDQFESYRCLGKHIIERMFRDIDANTTPIVAARKLKDLWSPSANTIAKFVEHTRALDGIWERLRTTNKLGQLQQELFNNLPSPARAASIAEECLCVELLQLIENVYLDLRLDDNWGHPDNRGWQRQLLTWVKSGTLQSAWRDNKNTFGLRFQVFCKKYLGLP